MSQPQPGAYLLFFGDTGHEQVVWCDQDDVLRGDPRYTATLTRFTVDDSSSGSGFLLKFGPSGAERVVKSTGGNLVATPDLSQGTLFQAEALGGSSYRLRFADGAQQYVVKNVTNVGLQGAPAPTSGLAAASVGTVFEFVEVPKTGDYAVVRVEVTSLDAATKTFDFSLTADPPTWQASQSGKWISGDGNIYTPPSSQSALVMELVSSTAAPSPTFEGVSIGPQGGPLAPVASAPTSNLPFSATMNGAKTRLTLEEASADGGKIWLYQLALNVDGVSYTHDPRIYNDGTGGP